MDQKFLMDVLFNRKQDWVGFEKPKPLDSNLKTLVYYYNGSKNQKIVSLLQVCEKQKCPKIDFSYLITEVLNASKILFPYSTLYVGEENKELWMQIMPKYDVNLDLIWDESGDPFETILIQSKYYIFKLLDIKMLTIVSMFTTIFFISPIESFGNETYLMCTNQDMGLDQTQQSISDLWIQFSYKQQQQSLQFSNLFKWSMENNKPAKWVEEEEIKSPIYIPKSPVYIPQSPVYIPSDGETWLNNNINL